MEETEIIPVGWNNQREAGDTQQNPCLVKEIWLEKEIIPEGWISKREASNVNHNLGAIDKKPIIPGGWNSQKEVRNTKHNPGPVEPAKDEKEMELAERGQQ